MLRRLWPVAVMSSFSLRTQRVNGCWDYAMACQTPFSSPALLSSLLLLPPLQTGSSQIRHSCTFQSDAFECCGSAAHALAPTWEQNRGALFFVYHEDFPLPEPLIYPAAGKAVARIYNRLIGSHLQRRTSENICLHSYSRWRRLKMVRKYHNRLSEITDGVVFIRLLRSFMFLS